MGVQIWHCIPKNLIKSGFFAIFSNFALQESKNLFLSKCARLDMHCLVPPWFHQLSTIITKKKWQDYSATFSFLLNLGYPELSTKWRQLRASMFFEVFMKHIEPFLLQKDPKETRLPVPRLLPIYHLCIFQSSMLLFFCNFIRFSIKKCHTPGKVQTQNRKSFLYSSYFHDS